MILGAGYDTIPISQLIAEIGWQVTVPQDRIAHLALASATFIK